MKSLLKKTKKKRSARRTEATEQAEDKPEAEPESVEKEKFSPISEFKVTEEEDSPEKGQT